MYNDVEFHGLKSNEIYPDLARIISETKQKFGIPEKIDVFIVDSFEGYPNVQTKQERARYRQWDFKLYDTLYISRGILKKLNSDEYKALISHEFSHIIHQDSKTFSAILSIDATITFLLFILTSVILGSISSKLFILSFFVIPIGIIFGLRNINCRRRKVELRCDADAVYITQNAEVYQRALKKMFIDFDPNIVANHNKKLIRTAMLSVYYYIVGDTHPSNFERILYIEVLKIK
jgi:Zn-dependent protease with chaperone function